MSFVSQTTILFSREKVYGASECVFLVRGFATDWRFLVARGNFNEAWETIDKGYSNDALLVGIVDDNLNDMLMDPNWLKQYQTFRNWVWARNNVWLADVWSMRISKVYPIFGFQNRFILERSAECFKRVRWLFDVNFVTLPSAGYGMDVSCIRVISNDNRTLAYHNNVSSPADLVSGVIGTLTDIIGCNSPSSGDSILKLFGNDATSVFIPSPGALVYLDLAISQNKEELRRENLEVYNAEGNAKDGSPLLNIDILFPNGCRFLFSGRDVFKDLDLLHNMDLPSWYYE